MKMAHVSVYIGNRNQEKMDADLKIMVEHILEADKNSPVYIIGNNGWGPAFGDQVILSDKIIYGELKSVHDSTIFFDQASYNDQDKNIIRRVCILAPMHANRVVVVFSNLDKKGVFESTILKLCKDTYTADSSLSAFQA